LFVIPDCRVAASPESIITGQRLWIPGSALTRGPGMTNRGGQFARHSGLPRSGKSGIHNHRSAAMDSGLRADARPRNDEPRVGTCSSFRIAAKAASPKSIITGRRLWLPGSALTRSPGMTNGRSALVRHSGLPRSGKSGIHNHRSAAMASGLRADARPRNDEREVGTCSSFRIAAQRQVRNP